jgi:hypothetical protein
MIDPKLGPKCRSCDAAIFWRRHLTSNKMAPLNMGPDPTGNIELIGAEEYGIVPVKDREAFLQAGGLLFKSHYATCPQAKTWKTGRKK